MTIRVAIIGATGKMGRVISSVVEATDGFEVTARLDSSSPLSDMLGADLAVDVTAPATSPAVIDFAVSHGLDVVVGTSGWSAERIATLRTTLSDDSDVGVAIVPNFSLGSVLATHFSTLAARFFDSIEIVESHRASKVDSPSGTAVRTAELIGAARAELGPVVAPHVDQRARGQQVASIPIHSLRMNGVVARQDVVFGGAGEILTLSHETVSAEAYEAGIAMALKAVAGIHGVVVGLDKIMSLDDIFAGGDPSHNSRPRSGTEKRS